MKSSTIIWILVVLLIVIGGIVWVAQPESGETVEEGVPTNIHPNPPLPASGAVQTPTQ